MILGFVGLLIFLFSVYQLSRDDFVFLRKNISVEQLFNMIFLALPFILFASRIGYVVSNPSWTFLNPLVFFLIPYFPGLSLSGGIIGGLLFVTLFSQKKKMPIERIMDIFFLSLLISIALLSFISAAINVLLREFYFILNSSLAIGELVLFLFLLRKFLAGRWADGLVGAVILVGYCLFTGLSYLFTFFVMHRMPPLGELILLGLLFLFSLVFLGRRGKFMTRQAKVSF